MDFDTPIPVVFDDGYMEGVPVPPPSLEGKKDLIRFLQLFETNDHVQVCLAANEDGNPGYNRLSSQTAQEIIEELKHKDISGAFGDLSEHGAWIGVNPVDGQGTRDANVTSFHRALLQSDEGDIEDQLAIIQKLKLPCDCIIHSGGRSLHAIVRIEAESLREYRDRVDMLYQVATRAGLKVDRKHRGPSRLTRMPGVMRGKRLQYIAVEKCGMETWADWQAYVEDLAAAVKAYSCRSWGAIRDLELPPRTYFLGNAFALGMLHAIFGQGGLGKSRISLNIARNQVLGLRFANLPTGNKPLRHLFMGSENSIYRLQDDIRRMSQGLTLEQSELLANHIFLTTLEGPTDSYINLGDPNNIARWQATIQHHRPDVLWVDPWGDVIAGDQNSDADTRAAVSELLRLARICRPDAAVVVLSHARTGIKNIEQAIGYDAANFGKNSKALHACARCVFNLAPGSEEENPPLVMSHAKLNDGPPVPPFALRLDPETHLYELDTSFDFEAWRTELNDRAKGKRRGRNATLVSLDKAFEIIANHGIATKTEARTLLRDVGFTRDRSDDALRQLQHAGRLTSWTPIGKNMPTYLGTPEAIQNKRRVEGAI